MSKIRKKSEDIRSFILTNVTEHPQDIATITAEEFNITRQAVNKHIRKLVDQNSLAVSGATKSRVYTLQTLVTWTHHYPLADTLEEYEVWRKDIFPRLEGLPDNVIEIWEYGFTEMFNNAIDHSAGSRISIELRKSAVTSEIFMYDDGEGIFKKIQREMNLTDEKHAVLELSKGKLTTDPDNHTGEGIFFSSRMFDMFNIYSGNTTFSHEFHEVEDWILERVPNFSGTGVFMRLNNNTSRTVKKVFDSFTSGDDYGFTKTVVPVRLAQYGNEKLVSRSQAKRLLARIDRFKVVLFDFEGIDSIGQAFADEVFRVFNNHHPEIELHSMNTTKNVQAMINRAVNAKVQ
ncbi:MAG: DUF4325 domain-containing protein [Thiolinea sp.]